MLQNKQYVTLLKTGVAEIGAYRALFPDVNNYTFPLFQARPWPNANHFRLTVDRICDAAEGYPFGFLLDSERQNYASSKPAQEEFDELFDESGGFEKYFAFVRAISGAFPVINTTSSTEVLLRQIDNAETLDRGLIIHQRRNQALPVLNAILEHRSLPSDTIIVLDAGWSRDYNSLEAWTLPMLGLINNAIPDAEVVVMSSSFPDNFSHIVGSGEEFGSERRLFSVSRQRFNQADLTFGDWGSTRPTLGGGGGAIPSRIDVPNPTGWHIFREDPSDDRGFCEAAWAAKHHPCFDPAPDCWGKQMIDCTDDEGNGITSRKVATEARINIHMTVHSGAISVLPTDEVPYQD